MRADLVDEIMSQSEHAPQLYYRLILVVGLPKSGKTAALRAIQKRTGAPLRNVNLELSRRMLDLTAKQQILRAQDLFAEMVKMENPDLVLLDNLELLFDTTLKQDPLRLLLSQSRNRIIIAGWNGEVRNGYLVYAKPDHAEYRRCPLGDFICIEAGEPA